MTKILVVVAVVAVVIALVLGAVFVVGGALMRQIDTFYDYRGE